MIVKQVASTVLALLSSAVCFSQMQDVVMHENTKPVRPLTVKSNEATKKQLEYAKAEGDSVSNAVNWIVSEAAPNSGQISAGEYKISYALSKPEGWYELSGGEVKWKEPYNANAHLYLFVQDGADGRVVPPLDVTLTIYNDGNELVESKALPFAWMPLISGYGENISLPQKGQYHFLITIAPPQYHRHDPYNGDRFMQPATAHFTLNYAGVPGKVLSESMEDRQDLARKAGQAYSNTLKAMYKQANDGKDTTMGDYFFACAVEYSEGYWYQKNNKMVYKMDNELSAENNAHIEVSVRDNRTGRFLYNLMPVVTLYDKGGKKLGTKMEMFMWHPWLYHYGENWRVPKAGSYRVHVHIDPPAYRRYGKRTGRQFSSPADLDFQNITIKTGQK